MTEPMSDARLAEIEARVLAAQETRMPPNRCRLEDGTGEYGSEEEANFLVQGLVDVPDLLAEVRRLREALKPFAHHAQPGMDSRSDRERQIRVTEGQVVRADFTLLGIPIPEGGRQRVTEDDRCAN